MIQDDAVLQQVVEAMVDGTPIDWASAESSAADARMRRVLRELQVIAGIAEVHGTVQEPDATAAASGPLIRTWSALRLLDKVGEGAFGEVYRAWDPRLDREVALKLLRRDDSPDARAASAVIDEGRMLAQVRHPNVVTVHGADRSAGRVGLWMEFIHGRTLEQVLRDQGPCGAAEASLVGLDLCRALSAVHRAGLLHRDIKAQNVMREDGGRIVLMDFGTGLDHADDSEDSAAGLAGTPLYMAPEILDGHDASVESDIYSVGVLLHRLVTGSYPVQGRSVQEVRDKHARGERTLLRDARPDLPERFVQVVERALSPGPGDRYQSAGAMEAALALASQTAQPVSAPVSRAAWPWPKVAIAAGLLLLAGLGSRWLPVGKSEPPVIAVLPFKNLSVEPDSDYFVDGLTDEVIRNLSVIDGLTVRSSTSSFVFKRKPRNVREVGQQLHADMVLEASVLRVGTELRIDAQLVRAADDVSLWSGRFDRELKDIFAIQDEISRAIVNKLRLTLGRGQRRYNTDLDAYELYLKGDALVGRRGVPSLEKAIEAFKQVLVKDPAFAPAQAGLAIAYARMGVPSGSPIPFETVQAIIRTAAAKALELDPLLADAHTAMGWRYSRECDWSSAGKSFQRALELNPRLTQTYTSYSTSTLRPLGKTDEALRLLRVALENDPLSLDVQREIGEVQVQAGRYDEAIDTLQRVRAVEPDFPFADSHLARALVFAGRPAEALSVFDSMPSRQAGRVLARPPRLVLPYVKLGRRAEAEEIAAQHADGPPSILAVIYAALGDKDGAFAALERMAVVEPQRVPVLLAYPEMATLRGDPRMAPFRKRFNLP